MFEKMMYQMSRRIFLTPVRTVATLEEYLYATTSKQDPVKNLSSKKDGHGGNTADIICDAFENYNPNQETQSSFKW